MKKTVIVSAILCAFLLVQFAEASFTYNSAAIRQTYSSGDTILGSISIGLQNESYDAIVSTNLNGSIALGDLLGKNGFTPNVEYSCSNTNCSEGYVIGDIADSIPLAITQPATVGFRVSGSNISIQGFSMGLASDAGPACMKQFSLNVFGDQQHYLQNTKYVRQACSGKLTGCFDGTLPDNSYTDVNLSSTPYCIKQTLPAAPAYEIGATLIRPSTSLNEKLTMSIYPADFSTTSLGSCILPNSTQTVQDVSCVVQYGGTTEQDYYICISSDKQTSGYQIQTEQTNPTCGALATNPSNIQKDFNLFAEPLTFDSPSFTVSDNLFNQVYYTENFSQVANAYIQKTYGGDCIQNQCIIPFEIIGGGQNVTITNPSMTYTSNGIYTTETKLYSVQKQSATVSAGNISLNLAPAGFNIPYGTLPSSLAVYIDGQLVTRLGINVSQGVSFDISPKFALIGIPTQFTVQSSSNITSTTWNFGEGDNSIAQGNPSSYSYSKPGSYNVMVTITTSDGRTSSRTIPVMVGEAQTSAEQLMSLSIQNIENINAGIGNLPSWAQPSISNKLNPSSLNDSLTAINNKLAVAANDSDFIQVITEIQQLNIPSSVAISKQGVYPLGLLYPTVDTSAIEQISGAKSTIPDQIRTAMLNWLNDNYDAQINISTISSSTLQGNSDLATLVRVSLNPKSGASPGNGQQYLIIDYPTDALTFKEAYGQKSIGSSTYIPLSGSATTMEFLIPDSVTIQTAGVYASPDLSVLQKQGEVIDFATSNTQTQTLVLVVGWIALIVTIIVIAFLLQMWYKKNYENKLFKKKDDLYNIMTFIYNSRRAGLQEGEIKKKLSAAGWKGEQIRYAFDKLSGRILGIFGIPIFRDAQEKKVRTEIEKRQEGKTGAKFIKRLGV